jgi:hypothetical protein
LQSYNVANDVSCEKAVLSLRCDSTVFQMGFRTLRTTRLYRVFTADQQDEVMTMHNVSSTVTPLPYRHSGRKSHRFYNALLAQASTSEEGDIKLAELVGYRGFQWL